MPDHGVFWGGGFADDVCDVGAGGEAGGGAGGRGSGGVAVQRADGDCWTTSKPLHVLRTLGGSRTVADVWLP